MVATHLPEPSPDVDDSAFLRAIELGALVGMAVMALVVAGIVLLGGQDLKTASIIAVWVGFVIGPYAGGLGMLSRVKQH
jgi:hypothetical protein